VTEVAAHMEARDGMLVDFDGKVVLVTGAGSGIVRTWHMEDWMTGLHQLGILER
jgi:hypothetical protein